jgi:hypothetical protein
MEQTQDLLGVRPSDSVQSTSGAENAPPPGVVTPQGATSACPTCSTQQGINPPNVIQNVYVLGRAEFRFPRKDVEKELRQVTARAGHANVDLTDRQVMHKILQDRANHYIARQLCAVLLVKEIETYILLPKHQTDYQVLLDAYRPTPSPADLDVVIGVRGPISPPAICNGQQVPILYFDQIYSFDRESLVKSIPKPKDADPAKFTAAAGEMFDQLTRESDNAGVMPSDIARNYLAVRSKEIYATAADEFGKNASFTSIDVLPSPLSGIRRIVDGVFTFTNRTTDVASKYFARVDVTEEWPFLVSNVAPFYDR